MRAPRDWVMTVSDHGSLEMLVEIRENGRLILRRFLSHDAAIIDNELAFIISETTRDVSGGGRR